MQKFIITETFSNKLLKLFKLKINSIKYKQLYNFMENNSILCRKIMSYVPNLYKLLCISKKFNSILDIDMFNSYLINECMYYEDMFRGKLYCNIGIYRTSLHKFATLVTKVDAYIDEMRVGHMYKYIFTFAVYIISIYTDDDIKTLIREDNNSFYNYIYVNNAYIFNRLLSLKCLHSYLTDDIDIIGISDKIKYTDIITIRNKKYRRYVIT